MEKKTMGAFISALRKANGLTQQQLADKLNISNKAVSRWERDECAPDITLIPALAEILGVTCDELLKGERILSGAVEEKSVKVEKQVKALINRAVSNFKTLIFISLGLSAVGLICMFGISYGAFRPLIGFIVMSVLAVSAFVVAAIGVSKLKPKRENELFDNADGELINRFNKALGINSYIAFFAVISVIVLSLPYLFFISPNVKSVLEFKSYLIYFLSLAPALVLAFLALKDLYFSRITGRPYEGKKEGKNSKLILMNMLQIGIAALSGILFIIAPFFAADGSWAAEDTLYVIAYFLLPASAIVFAVLLIKGKDDRKKLLFSGIRNLLLSIPAILMQLVHSATVNYNGMKKETWNIDHLLIAIGLTLTIFLIFEIIKICMRAKKEV